MHFFNTFWWYLGPLCLVAILVDPWEEVAPVPQVWMCSSQSVWNSLIIGWRRQVCKL